MISTQTKVKSALDKDFIKTDDMAEMLGLAFQHNMNCMIYGPPGYGKSEMVMSVIRSFGLEEQSFVKMLSVDIDTAELLGGLDIKRFRESNQVWYNCDDSFMSYPVVVFEEFADCPPSTLAMLKDILTAKMFRNGSQQYPLKTQVVIAITNHKPEEIADLGDWAKAILDRFPFRGEIYWDTHTKGDYIELFDKIKPDAAPDVVNQIAELSEQSGAKGANISPRVARNAIETCDSWYKEVSDSVAHQNLEHLSPLKWIPEYAAVVDDMKRHVEELRLREKALAEMKMHEKALRDARKRYGRVDKDGSITVADKSKEMDGIKQLVQVLMVAMGALSVPDDLVMDRDKMINKMTELMTDADSNIGALATYTAQHVSRA